MENFDSTDLENALKIGFSVAAAAIVIAFDSHYADNRAKAIDKKARKIYWCITRIPWRQGWETAEDSEDEDCE